MITMKITKVDDITPFDNAHGVDARKIYDSTIVEISKKSMMPINFIQMVIKKQ